MIDKTLQSLYLVKNSNFGLHKIDFI